MQVKTFQIRLTKEHLHADQNELNAFLDSVTIKKSATHLINGAPDYWSVLLYYTQEKPGSVNKPSEKTPVPTQGELTEEELKIYETLKEWRYNKSIELKLSSYIINSNADLMRVARIKPASIEELAKIKGFGEQKISKYGSDIIAVLNSVG